MQKTIGFEACKSQIWWEIVQVTHNEVGGDNQGNDINYCGYC